MFPLASAVNPAPASSLDSAVPLLAAPNTEPPAYQAVTRIASTILTLIHSTSQPEHPSTPRPATPQALVKLCMVTDSLTDWLPAFSAARASEACQLAELAQSEADADAAPDACSDGVGLSPGGAWSARRPAPLARTESAAGEAPGLAREGPRRDQADQSPWAQSPLVSRLIM